MKEERKEEREKGKRESILNGTSNKNMFFLLKVFTFHKIAFFTFFTFFAFKPYGLNLSHMA